MRGRWRAWAGAWFAVGVACVLTAVGLPAQTAPADSTSKACDERWVVLVHSPELGPTTMQPLAATLRARGYRTVVPTLPNPQVPPFWAPEVLAISRAADSIPTTCRVIIIGHGGAGALMAAVGYGLRRPVAGFVFVDAAVPEYGVSRLSAMQADDSLLALRVELDLRAGHRFPQWTDADLRSAIPDSAQRAVVLAELRPQPLEFFTEPLPGFTSDEPQAACAYLRFTEAYVREAAWARIHRCAEGVLRGSHFQLLTAPDAVANRVFDLLDDAAHIPLSHAASNSRGVRQRVEAQKVES